MIYWLLCAHCESPVRKGEFSTFGCGGGGKTANVFASLFMLNSGNHYLGMNPDSRPLRYGAYRSHLTHGETRAQSNQVTHQGQWLVRGKSQGPKPGVLDSISTPCLHVRGTESSGKASRERLIFEGIQGRRVSSFFKQVIGGYLWLPPSRIPLKFGNKHPLTVCNSQLFPVDCL